MRDVEVVGVATSRFGKHLDRLLGSLAAEVLRGALEEAAMTSDDVESVVFSNAAAGVLSGQEMIRDRSH